MTRLAIVFAAVCFGLCAGLLTMTVVCAVDELWAWLWGEK